MSQAHQLRGCSAIVLATRNKGKIGEFAELLTPFGLEVFSLDDFSSLPDIEETGETFADNALLKARGVSRATGLVSVADDSGLEVDALGKAPGVYSARYSERLGLSATDERNVEKLLADLAGVPAGRRAARFRCCMAASSPTGEFLLAEGVWEGIVAVSPAGNNGFGYDPVFFDLERGCTVAQMSREEKNTRSHRARAAAALLGKWPAFWRAWLEKVSGEKA